MALSLTSRGDVNQKLEFSFKLYDLNRDGKVYYKEVLAITSAIYKMVGPMVTLPEDEKTPELRAEKLFTMSDKDPNVDYLDFNDFKRLVKNDPSLLNSLNAYEGLV